MESQHTNIHHTDRVGKQRCFVFCDACISTIGGLGDICAVQCTAEVVCYVGGQFAIGIKCPPTQNIKHTHTPSTLCSTPSTLSNTPSSLRSTPSTRCSTPATLWSTPTTLCRTLRMPTPTPVPRLVVTLLHQLRREGKRRGLATLCIGGGEATAIVVEHAE